MDSGKTLKLKVTSKRVGGGQIRLNPISAGPLLPAESELPPVHLDTIGCTTGGDTVDLDTVAPVELADIKGDPLAYAAQLRTQAAQLIQQAAQIEAAAAATIPGADGRNRPTWDRWNNDHTRQQVRELFQAGESVRAIARTIGCSHGTAHNIIRELGL